MMPASITIDPGPLTDEVRHPAPGTGSRSGIRPFRLALGVVALVLIRAVAGLVIDVSNHGMIPLAPPPWVLASAAIAGTGVIAWAVVGRRGSVRACLIGTALVAGFLASLAPLGHDTTPMGRFRALYWAIGTGMTATEIQTAVDHYFTSPKPRVRLDPNAVGFISFGPIDADYDAEVIRVFMSDGRVVSKDYLPD